jgi:hypothetical protein
MGPCWSQIERTPNGDVDDDAARRLNRKDITMKALIVRRLQRIGIVVVTICALAIGAVGGASAGAYADITFLKQNTLHSSATAAPTSNWRLSEATGCGEDAMIAPSPDGIPQLRAGVLLY